MADTRVAMIVGAGMATGGKCCAAFDPVAIAENYRRLHCQPRSAWTHELYLRPWIEPW